jgi:serine/threonine protein kinase
MSAFGSGAQYITRGDKQLGSGSFKVVYDCKPATTNTGFGVFEQPIGVSIDKLCVAKLKIKNKRDDFEEFVLQNKFDSIGLGPKIYEIQVSFNDLSTGVEQIEIFPQSEIATRLLGIYKPNIEYTLFVLQEKCEGNLDKYITHNRKTAADKNAFDDQMFHEIIKLVDKLLDHDIIHMDIKSGNTCPSLDAAGQFYLRALDFDPVCIFNIPNKDPEMIAHARIFMIIQIIYCLAYYDNIVFDKTIIDKYLNITQGAPSSSSSSAAGGTGVSLGLKEKIGEMISYFLTNPYEIISKKNPNLNTSRSNPIIFKDRNPIYMFIHYIYNASYERYHRLIHLYNIINENQKQLETLEAQQRMIANPPRPPQLNMSLEIRIDSLKQLTVDIKRRIYNIAHDDISKKIVDVVYKTGMPGGKKSRTQKPRNQKSRKHQRK